MGDRITVNRTHLPVDYLLVEARRLNLARWIVALLGGIVLFFSFHLRGKNLVAVAALLVSVGIFAGVFEWLYHSIKRSQNADLQKVGQKLMRYVLIQVLYEVAVLLALVHLTGGPLSPAPLIFLLSISMLAVIFPNRQLALITGYIVLGYVALMESYALGWWWPVMPLEAYASIITPSFIRAVEIVFVLAFVLTSILVAERARQLHRAWAETQEKNAFLDHVNEMMRQSLTATDIQTLCQILADQIGGILGVESVYIDAWNEETKTPVFMAAWGPLRGQYSRQEIAPRLLTVTASMRQLGGPLVIQNARNSPYISPEVASRFFAHAILALPIYGYPDKVYWGAVWLAFQREYRFTANDIQRAQQVTDVVSLLISRVRLYQETLSRAELLQDFSLQVTRLTSDLRHTTLLPGIVESARSLLKAQRAALFMRVADKEHLTCGHAIGLSDEYIHAVNRRTRPILEEIVFSEPVVLVPDVVQDVRTTGLFDAIREEGFCAYGIFALTSPEGPRGALAVYWDRPHVISAEEVATARLFAERASDVLHNADLYAQAAEQSLTDELTSLPNRRALDRQMGQESARSFRSGRPFTLVMMDLDGFKSINDNFGHPIGDSVLQQVAMALRRAVRATDFIARYGGDEFAVILPETDMDAARLVAEKLRQSLATCDLRMPNATQRYVSACMGLAVFPHDTTVPEKLIEIADKRLYRAKHTRWGTIVTES